MTNLESQLNISCAEGNLSKVKKLVEQGVDIHILDGAPLRWAAYNGNLEVVKYLVERGADIHECDDYALKFAAASGHLEIVNYLRSVAGSKWKCFDCIVRTTCLTLCHGWDENG